MIYLKSKEKRIIDLIKKNKEEFDDNIFLITKILETEKIPSVDMSKPITTEDKEFLYVHSLLKKTS